MEHMGLWERVRQAVRKAEEQPMEANWSAAHAALRDAEAHYAQIGAELERSLKPKGVF